MPDRQLHIRLRQILSSCCCFAGVCGIALSMAGAKVILTDLPHITPLTQHNLDVNCGHQQQRSKVGCEVNELLFWTRMIPC